MKANSITVNGVEITANADGSIVKPFHKRTKHTFGYKNARGYMEVRVGGFNCHVHRIIAEAFLSKFSDFPQVDHIDGNKANNDISNLRMATHASNLRAHQNKPKGCSSQYRGVTWDKRLGRWKAQCKINYKGKGLGRFDNERDAALARDTYVFSQGYPLEGLNFPECFESTTKI
jgi:hypothetical protein